ncbi:lasso peptide biosynthesis PqqD family chaperone [Bacillus sp. JJ722]|uniref:lasso peptide biosynthesis PqqD family chaperone n=1 Tax=Bacillus sp. JJ722 TaxID=3122973 RepID=UPI0030004B69
MIMNGKITNNHLFSQKAGNIVSDMDGEKVMLNIQNSKYYNLGHLGGEIWDLLKEPIAFQDLISLLLTNYDISQAECEQQVSSFLEQLLEEGLIQIEEQVNS